MSDHEKEQKRRKYVDDFVHVLEGFGANLFMPVVASYLVTKVDETNDTISDEKIINDLTHCFRLEVTQQLKFRRKMTGGNRGYN